MINLLKKASGYWQPVQSLGKKVGILLTIALSTFIVVEIIFFSRLKIDGYFYSFVVALVLNVLFFLLALKLFFKIKVLTQKLKQQENVFNTTVDFINEGLIITNTRGKIVYMNHYAEMLTEWQANEAKKIATEKVYNVVSETNDVAFDNIINRIIKNGKPIKNENNTILKTKNLNNLIITSSGLPLFNEVGDISGTVIVFNDVTKKGILTKQEEGKYQALFEQAADGIFILDPKGNFTEANSSGCQMLGYSKEEVLKLHITNITPQKFIDKMPINLSSINSGNNLMVERQFIRSDGSIFDAECSARLIHGGYYQAFVRDITERKKIDKALNESNERYELVAKATSDMVWDWNLVTGEIFRSKEGWEKTFTNIPYKKIGNQEDWQLRVHPDDKEKIKNIKPAILASKNNLFNIECRILSDDGNYVHIEDKGFIIRDKVGKPIRLIGAAKNITERKLVEEELKKLSIIAKATQNSVIITDTTERIQWVNEAFTRITEFTFEEVIGKKPSELLQGPETSRVVLRYMRLKIKKGVAFKCDILNYTKTGKKYWLRIECQPQFNTAGTHIGFFALQTDITKEKEAEATIKSSEEKYRYLFNNNPASIMIWDIDTFNILQVNNTASKLYGYSIEEFTNLTIFDLRRPDEYDKIKAFIKQVKTKPGFKSQSTWKHINKRGQDIFMQITSHKILYKGKMVIMALANDVTDKILLEENFEKEKKIKQKQITEAVITAQENEREHIGSELHDNINQILASALLYIGICKRDTSATAFPINETDKLINSAIKEIRDLTHSMIAPSLEETSLASALNNIMEIAEKTGSFIIHNNIICLDENSMPDKMKLSIYRIVQEVFTNIHKYAKAKNVYLTLNCDNEKIILSIKDDGVGFNTKKKSNGVGLMNIKTRASLYNGKVAIISSTGNGCEVSITFDK